jgi:hypothetical protein
VAALINIDPIVVGKWAEDRGISYTTFMDLSAKPEVAKLVNEQVTEINSRAEKEHFRIKRFAILYKLLDMDDGELTKTGKIRRKFVREKYQNLYDALYDESISEKEVEAFFQYQDGQSTNGQNQDFILYHGRVLMSYFFQLVVSGIVVGSIYALAALGFVLIYKSSKVLNIAHGQIIAAGAFIAYALTGMAGIPIYISFLLSMVITFFLAMSVERIFLRRLIGEPIISVIMVTIGLMSILDGLIFLTPFGSVNFSFPLFLPQT